ncbi:cysteine desulfurase / selenocysteine lyase [Flexibacter flexilis DSM 6793]|uniref:Cysteine desulfurase n=1 Tax=Flexibacter flexilis DSM 6793 TaxID=927664 RepID=A0A1I1H1W6_9BACT|nr:cysteine desulfurase [Flexibacter flexilis]SFC15423.1 cysteine desulfurase / selenocysteine lyase [Flexibacter flexilis DSM 6793]
MAISTTTHTAAFDVAKVREDFPILHQSLNGKPLVYFDNAATTQKPRTVIDAISHYYQNYNANIHRGIHTLAEKATAEYERTRQTVRAFIGAAHAEEIIFTRGTTEGINLVAATYGRQNLKAGDEVIVSHMEHHSNIVPWQMLCEEKGATLRVIPITDSGELVLEEYAKLLSEKTKIVSVVFASNSLGTINPIADIIRQAHAVGAKVMIDGAQATSHLDVDVQAIDCDFYAFSSHKLYGPTGIGVLYGKKELLEAMPPYQGGGEMISDVSFARTTYNDLPYKFEAGTPNIADTIALRAAIEYINQWGKPVIAQYEDSLLQHATTRLQNIDGVRLIGTAKHKVSVNSFVVDGIHPFDLGVMLDAKGIAVRTGQHCTQPLMERLCIEGTSRASFALYNTIEEIDYFADCLEAIVRKYR